MRFVFFFTAMLLIACESNKQVEEHEYDYPGLGMILETYYFDYYNYPNNIKDLVTYVELRKFPENFNTTISKLNKNIDEIIFVNDQSKLIITLDDSTIYETALRNPCEELSYDFPVYISQVLCFDKNGHSITSDAIVDDFKSGLKKIKKQYTKVEKDENTNNHIRTKRLIIIKFEPLEGLSSFCGDNIRLKKYDYFQEVEKYLMSFSNKYELSKVIFTTPIFYK